MFFKVGLILLLVKFSLQASTPESPFYEAAVVEFAYETNPTYNPSQLLNSNLRQYLEIMMSAPQNLDIIVFPEMTLNAMSTAVEISEPSQKIIPCDNGNYTTENLVKQISCSAKHFQRYVVVNIVTKVNCPDPEMIANNDKRNCSSRADGFSYYNTNVVFDRKGEIISRYRKFNLFGESVDKPKRPALVTFVTDFGVTFGTFICFDLMFKRPALELIRNSNITDIVFTSMWFSEMPFLTGVQAQQNWAFANNVNLLAAGANNPLIGSTGSGIYAARYGSLTSIMQGISQSQILTATVPKRTNFNSNVVRQATRFTPEHMRSLKLKRDQLDRYTSNLNVLQLGPNASWNYTVVHNNVSCVFRLRYTMRFEPNTKPYEFRVAAYDGNRTFDGFADGGVATCAIFACLNGTLSSCGIRDASYQSNIDWHSIEIVATMPNDDNGGYFYMPTTLDSSIMPLSTQDFIYSVLESDANRTKIVMTSSRELNDFLTFGIYGRNFNLDDDDDESDSAALRFSSLLIAVSILAIFNA